MKNSAAVLQYRSGSYSYWAYWQNYGVSFIILVSLGVVCYVQGIRCSCFHEKLQTSDYVMIHHHNRFVD